MVADVKIDGHYFNAVDIAIADESGEPIVFRISMTTIRKTDQK